MIHLFNCLGECCTYPGKLCRWCGETCQDTPCARCFQDCGENFTEFLNRPLGGFVFMAVWVGAVELGCCGFALANGELLEDCHFPEPQLGLGAHLWLLVQLGFAALSLLFAPYLQAQVWRTLMEEAEAPDDPEGPVSERTRQAQSATGPVRASKRDVLEAFKKVFMYDIGFCLYFFVLLASFSCSYYGAGQIAAEAKDCDVKPAGFPRYSAWAGMSFVAFVFLYGFAWYTNMACMDRGETLLLRRGLEVAQQAYLPPKAAAARTEGPPAEGGGGGRAGFVRKATAGVVGGLLEGAAKGVAGMRGKSRTNAALQPEEPPEPAPPPPSQPSCIKSFAKLLASIGLDILGNATYLIPAVGEYGDVVFAPASAVMVRMMYNANGIAAVNLVEELLPFTDIVPTATIAWFLQTCAPDNKLTRGLGINNEWAMTGAFQR